MSKRTVASDPKRDLIEYQEYLKDRSEDHAAALATIRVAGDEEAADRLSKNFAQWRSEYLRVGEKKGLYKSGVAMSTEAWFHWGCIAFDGERIATSAGSAYRATGGESDPKDELGRAFRASSIAIVSAAFMIEGLYGSVCYFVPPVDGSRRWSIVLRTCRMLFDLSGIERLDQQMKQLFGLRDDAAHPWVAVRPPKPHPYGLANTSVEVATYTPEVASESIDLACSLLDRCTLHPLASNRSAKRWAQDQRAGVERLMTLRG